MPSPEQPSVIREAVIDLTDTTLRTSGYVVEGDVIGVEAAMAAGLIPLVVNPFDWPLPASIRDKTTTAVHAANDARIAVMDELIDIHEQVAILRPPSLLVALHVTPYATESDSLTALTDALATANLARSSVAGLITVPDHADHSAVRSLGIEVQATQEEAMLQARTDINQRTRLESQLLAQAGRGANIVLREREFTNVTVCIARRKPTPRRLG